MRQWILLAAALALLLFGSPGGIDVGELVPVEVLYVSAEKDGIRIAADTGDMGMGYHLEAAVADMKSAAEGTVFLDTAEYLVVSPEAAELLPQLCCLLRPATEVYLAEKGEQIPAAFLQAHPSEVTLNEIRSGQTVLPKVIREGERYHVLANQTRA